MGILTNSLKLAASCTALVLLLTQPSFGITVDAPTTVARFRTTNSPESAPLNSISRNFRHLQQGLGETVESDQLSYSWVLPAGVDSLTSESRDAGLKHLLININDGAALETIKLDELKPGLAADPSIADRLAVWMRTWVDTDSASIGSSDGSSDNSQTADLIASFLSTITAASVRDDIHFTIATVTEDGEPTQSLLIQDDETHDVLILSFKNTSIQNEPDSVLSGDAPLN